MKNVDHWKMSAALSAMTGILKPPAFNGGRIWRPRLDVIEDEAAYILRAAVPGRVSDEIQITLQGNLLLLTTNDSSPDTPEHDSQQPPYRRAVWLPADIDSSSAHAEINDGILTLLLPKSRNGGRKRINIQPT